MSEGANCKNGLGLIVSLVELWDTESALGFGAEKCSPENGEKEVGGFSSFGVAQSRQKAYRILDEPKLLKSPRKEQGEKP